MKSGKIVKKNESWSPLLGKSQPTVETFVENCLVQSGPVYDLSNFKIISHFCYFFIKLWVENLKIHVFDKSYLETGTTLNALIASIDSTHEYFTCENLYGSSFSVFCTTTS